MYYCQNIKIIENNYYYFYYTYVNTNLLLFYLICNFNNFMVGK